MIAMYHIWHDLSSMCNSVYTHSVLSAYKLSAFEHALHTERTLFSLTTNAVDHNQDPSKNGL